MSIERLIFANLVHNEEYARKVSSFLKRDYFIDTADKAVFSVIDDYFRKYNSAPSKTTVKLELDNIGTLNDEVYKNALDIVNNMKEESTNLQWLVDETEKFCQDKALYNGIKRSISILDGNDKGHEDKGAIPGILTEALGVSFDTKIGHDFVDDSTKRFEYYRSNVARIPFDLEFFNKITGGGTPKKTLNVIMAGVHVGKSLFLCHLAASALMQGQNVLYITMELAEEEVGRRIDANLLDIPIAELGLMPLELLTKKIERLKTKTKGKLVIKEYPTSSAGSGHFRHLLNELKAKKSFKPDMIVVDYLNICASSRMKYGASVNSYTLVKAIAEELRGLAVEFEVPLWTATQTTREGSTSSDIGMENVAESFGLPATADFMVALINTEELEHLGQLLVKQLKNRYTDAGLCRRFVVGVDRTKMRIYDVENNAQDNLFDGPIMDNTKFGQEDKERSKKSKKDIFSSFK